jgi:hypothetical protein
MPAVLPTPCCERWQGALAGAVPRWTAALGLAALCACGSGRSDFVVHDTSIVVNSGAEFTKRADFPSRVESTLHAALRYWGGSWRDLEGKTVAFEGDQHVACAGRPGAIGCYEGGQIRVSTRDANFTFHCVEETVLVHEVGHAVIGDPDHTDPRWMDFTPVVQDLSGREGYDETGDVSCEIFVNVWRHP